MLTTTIRITSNPQTPQNTRAHHAPVGGGEWIHQTCGGHSIGETPGNIPNPEAKPNNADGTAPDRVWESRKPPQPHHKKRWGVEPLERGEHACVPCFPMLHPPPPFHTHQHTHNNPCKWCTRHANTQPGANPDYYCKDAQPHPTHTEHNASKKTQNTAPARRTQMLLMARNCQLHKQRWRNPFDIRLQIIIPLRQANAH